MILATWPRDYVDGLTGTCYKGAPDSEEALAGINRWIALFARACRRAAEDAGRFEEQLRALQDSGRERLGSVRRGSAADLLVRASPGASLLTATTASDLIGRSCQAIDRLVEAGILTRVTVGRRNRAFEAPELIEAFTALERQLASPEGDTLVSEPIRRVPRGAQYTSAPIFPLGQKRRVLRYRFLEGLEFTVLEDRPGAVRAAIKRVWTA